MAAIVMKIAQYQVNLALEREQKADARQMTSTVSQQSLNRSLSTDNVRLSPFGLQQSNGLSIVSQETQLYSARELAASLNKQVSSSHIQYQNGENHTINSQYEFEQLLSQITGQQISVMNAITSENVIGTALAQISIEQNAPVSQRFLNLAQQAGSVAQFELQSQFIEFEHEAMAFQAQGVVSLADGREIDFNLALSMDRSYFKQQTLAINRVSQAITHDPLVLDLSGDGPQLSTTAFEFDINHDGETENLAFTAHGSGFLVLDKNQDGKINNGSEMFGGVSGAAFAELAQHDQDGNLWIDENDAVFEKLQIWHLDGSGNKQLTSLKQAGVGALYLGAVDSGFTLKDGQNNVLGTIQKSGMYFKENGEAMSLSQFDLAALNDEQQNQFNIDQVSTLGASQTRAQAASEQADTELDNLMTWLASEESLTQIQQLISQFNAGEINLSQFVQQAQQKPISQFSDEPQVDEPPQSINPMIELLAMQTQRVENSISKMREKFASTEIDTDVRFEHMQQLIDMIKTADQSTDES